MGGMIGLGVRLTLVFALLAVPRGGALAQSGVRDSGDGRQILVNKDVGEERWAIAYDRASGTITGNVFFSDGREPAFLWCAPEGKPGAVEPGAPDLELACFGSTGCDEAPCTDRAWNFIADVALPVTFLVADSAVPPPQPTLAPGPTPTPLPVPEPTADTGVPASPDALFAYLQSGSYESFAAESSVHPTLAPHMSSVRTFLNPLLEQSLAAGASSHPVGSAAVKELYDASDVLVGWAAMVKVSGSDGNDESAWYWYEVFDVETGSPRIEGVGNSVCTGCHASGSDFVRVPFPLQ